MLNTQHKRQAHLDAPVEPYIGMVFSSASGIKQKACLLSQIIDNSERMWNPWGFSHGEDER